LQEKAGGKSRIDLVGLKPKKEEAIIPAKGMTIISPNTNLAPLRQCFTLPGWKEKRGK